MRSRSSKNIPFKLSSLFMIAVILAANIFMCILLCPGKVYADNNEKSGYWQLKETNVTTDENEIGEDGYASFYYSASELSHTEKVSRPKTDYHGAGGADMVVNCSRPPETIIPGEPVEMELSLQASYSGDYMLWGSYGSVLYGVPNDERNAIMYNAGIKFEAAREGDENTVFYDPYNPTNSEAHVQHVFESGYDEDDEIAILFYGNHSNTIWIYGWVDTAPKETQAEPEEDREDEKKDEKDRYWILDHVENSEQGSIEGEYYSSYGFRSIVSASGGGTEADGSFNYNLMEYDDNDELFNEFTNSVSWTAPPSRIRMGKEYEAGINVSFYASNWELDSSHVSFVMKLDSGSKPSELETADTGNFLRYESYQPQDSDYTIKDGVRYAPKEYSTSKTIFPDTVDGGPGINDLSDVPYDISNYRLIISAYDVTLDFNSGSVFKTEYIYRPNEAAAAAAGGEEDNPEPDKVFQDEYSDASTETGEDSGTNIIDDIFDDEDTSLPKAVGVSVGGAIIAGGTGVLVKRKKKGSGKEKNKDKKKKSSNYKMFVSKDFGDAIQKGAKPVAVRARIDEIDENGDRHPQLLYTQKIEVTGEDILVESLSMRGSWMEALVYADGNSEADKGTIIFTFTGGGGTFRNHVKFRLVGKPELIFPEIKDDGTWVNSGHRPVASVIAGAGGESTVPFMFLDASAEPEEIRFTTPDGIEISSRREEKYNIGYYAVIDNRTKEAEKESGVFAEMKTEMIVLEAVFSGDCVVREEFYVNIVPRGLSVLIKGGMNPLIEDKAGVRKKLKDGCLEVVSYATRQDDELTLDPLIRPTGFDLCFAFVDVQGVNHIEMGEECFEFGKMQPTDEATANILAKYNYEIGTTGGFSVEPQNSLPELKQKYFVKLPVHASKEGFVENADIPIRLLGEPYDPLQDWKTEYRELQLAILRYYPVEYAHDRLRYVREELNDPEIYDKSWLRAMRKTTIAASQDYWLKEADRQMKLIDYYDITDMIFRKPPRFMADVALKIVFKYYFGENEGWISPVFGMCLDILDDVLWDYITEGEINLDLESRIVDALLSALENYISISEDNGAGINMSANPEKVKKFAIFFMAWLIVDFYKNYTAMDPRDFYEAVRKECIDMSSLAGRKFLGVGLQRVMNSETVQKLFKQKWVSQITEYLRKNLASERVNIKAKGVDYRGNMKFNREFSYRGDVLNSDRADKFGGLSEGAKYIKFSKDGKVFDLRDLETTDKMQTMLPGAGGSQEFSQMEVTFGQMVTYVGIIQTYIEDFFSNGIAYFIDPEKLDPESPNFLDFHIFWKVTEIGVDISFRIAVNVSKLLTLVTTGVFFPPAFTVLYDYLIGWYPFSSSSKKELSNDVGREIGEMKKLPTAND